MTPVEKLTAAIEKLERLKAESTAGKWMWVPDEYHVGPEAGSLIATIGEWYRCEYFCRWSEQSQTHRGVPGIPGHEHLRHTIVIDAVGYEADCTSAEIGDRDLIVTLHRTIDAQLAILKTELAFAERHGWPAHPFQERLHVLALADAILGTETEGTES